MSISAETEPTPQSRLPRRRRGANLGQFTGRRAAEPQAPAPQPLEDPDAPRALADYRRKENVKRKIEAGQHERDLARSVSEAVNRGDLQPANPRLDRTFAQRLGQVASLVGEGRLQPFGSDRQSEPEIPQESAAQTPTTLPTFEADGLQPEGTTGVDLSTGKIDPEAVSTLARLQGERRERPVTDGYETLPPRHPDGSLAQRTPTADHYTLGQVQQQLDTVGGVVSVEQPPQPSPPAPAA